MSEEVTKKTKKPSKAEKLAEEVSRLKARITEKDKEFANVEVQYEEKIAHLQFMVNALNGDKQRLLKERNELRQRIEDWENPTFGQKLAMLFKRNAR